MRFGNAIVFYLSFDRHELAEITAGSPEPQRDRWAEFLKTRPEPYRPGVFGDSLTSGGYTLSYRVSPNVAAPQAEDWHGLAVAVASWLRGQSLHHRGEYYWPIRLHVGGSHSLMFGRMGDPRNKEQLYAYLEHGSHHASAVMGSMADWQPEDWHLVVVNWDRAGVELSLDGRPPVRSALREPLPAAEPGEFRVTVNSPTDDVIALDELLILNVPLAQDEIAWLHQAHVARAKLPEAARCSGWAERPSHCKAGRRGPGRRPPPKPKAGGECPRPGRQRTIASIPVARISVAPTSPQSTRG